LYWTMLAACTVGPGMVVTCARAGAEYKLHLIWPLIIASIFAYVSLEGTARLTIVSGKSLGECLQIKYSNGWKIWNVGIFCWVVVIAVFSGNLFYEANCFAGGLGAIYSLPPVHNTDAVRILSCIGYGVVVILLLVAGKTEALGVGLGGIMIGMVVLFLVVVIKLGVDLVELGLGFLPISMPTGSSNIVMSLIGTTGTGFNLFLGGEMARGKTLREARSGILFSTVMTFLVSVLILIVGSGTHHGASKVVFTMGILAKLIETSTGSVGIWTFGIGFIAAALSSMLTIPLGAALTAESVFTIHEQKVDEKTRKENQENAFPLSTKVSVSPLSISKDDDIKTPIKDFPKKYYNGLMIVMVLISMGVMIANAPEVKVILVAQVYNGCLLPFFYVCLLLCINDKNFMNNRPQTGWLNCCLIVSTFTTIVFTAKTIVEDAFGWLVTQNMVSANNFVTGVLVASLLLSVLVMILLFTCTNLGVEVRRSFGIFFRRTAPQEQGHTEDLDGDIYYVSNE